MNKASQVLATLDVELFYSVSISMGEIKLQGHSSRELLKHCLDVLNITSFNTTESYGFLKSKTIIDDIEVTVLLT